MTQQSYGIRPAGYRLPDATRLGRVRLQVSDLDRSVRYYEQVLGLRAIRRDENTASLATEDGETVLIELHARAGVRPAPPRATLGLFHFAILLPNRSALGRFVRHLAGIDARAGMADHFVSEALYLTDPDGLGIEVYADRARDAWRPVAASDGAGVELMMTTEPLDVEDLAAAADGAWTGMPAGTVLGHVHLHVGDLDRGAAFYHDAIGFDKVVWSYPGALFLSAGGYHHHLGTNIWARGPNPSVDQARLLSWDIVVPTQRDADAAAVSVSARGFEVHQDEDGAWRAVDPWGTALRLAGSAGP
jgi:catechol 2,3-dioxygenase